MYSNIYPFIFCIFFFFFIYCLNLKKKAFENANEKNMYYFMRKEIHFFDFIPDFKLKYILIFVVSTLFFYMFFNIRINRFENINSNLKDGNYNIILISKNEGSKFSDKYLVYLLDKKVFGEISLKRGKGKSKTNLKIGKIYNLNTQFNKLNNSFNPGTFDEKIYMFSNFKLFKGNVSGKIEEIEAKGFRIFLISNFSKLKEKVNNIFNKYVNSDISKSIVLGSKDILDKKTKETFKEVNIYHILSISGMHISYIYILISIFEKKFKNKKSKSKKIWSNKKKLTTELLRSLIILGYILLVGIGPSTIRAYISIVFYIICKNLFLKIRFIDKISFSFVICILINPLYIFSAGIYLSFFSVFALNIYSKIFYTNFKKEEFYTKILESVKISLIVQIFIIPILIYFLNTISINFILANILILFIAPLIIFLGFIFILLIFIYLFFSKISLIVSYTLNCINVFQIIHLIFNIFFDVLGKVLNLFGKYIEYAADFSKLKLSSIYYIPKIDFIYILIYYLLIYIFLKSIYIFKKKKEYILLNLELEE